MPVSAPVIRTTEFMSCLQSYHRARLSGFRHGGDRQQIGHFACNRKDFVWIDPYSGGDASGAFVTYAYFVAVAEEGSFTQVAAEKRLHTAQPSLSRQIRDLEAMVKVPLIIRETRGLSPSQPPGQVFWNTPA